MMSAMKAVMTNPDADFNGLKIYSGANMMSIMSLGQ